MELLSDILQNLLVAVLMALASALTAVLVQYVRKLAADILEKAPSLWAFNEAFVTAVQAAEQMWQSNQINKNQRFQTACKFAEQMIYERYKVKLNFVSLTAGVEGAVYSALNATKHPLPEPEPEVKPE